MSSAGWGLQRRELRAMHIMWAARLQRTYCSHPLAPLPPCIAHIHCSTPPASLPPASLTRTPRPHPAQLCTTEPQHTYWNRPDHTDSVSTAHLLVRRSGEASRQLLLAASQDERAWWWWQSQAAGGGVQQRVASNVQHGHTAFIDAMVEVPGAPTPR